MNDKIKAALAKVAARLQTLPKDQFQGELRAHTESELSSALLVNYSLANSHSALSIQRVCLKISQMAFFEQHVLSYKPQNTAEAANDETYLMAA